MEPANLQEEWGAVTSAPYLSVGILIVVIGIVWAVIHFLYRHQVGGLKRDLESEQAESTRLRGRVAEYELKAGRTPDEAHDRIEKLEQRLAGLAGRRLSSEQKDQLTAALAPTPAAVSLQYAMGTPDGLKFQRDFGEVFQRAGWEVSGGTILGGPESEHGLVVILRKNSAPFQIFTAALRAAGFEYGVWDQTGQAQDGADVGLLICPRGD